MIDPQTIVLVTLIGSLLLLVTDALRYDLVALLVVVVLTSTGTLTPKEAFAGFSSSAVVLIGSMYVFGHAMTRWGVAETIGDRLLAAGRASEAGLVLRITVVCGLLSGVLSNTGVVAIFIPLISSIARRRNLPVSRLLMPLAFASLLGGLLTVIGTSKNVAVNAVIEQKGGVPFELFDFTIYGLVLLGIGTLFLVGPGRMLLPRSRVDESLTEHYRIPRFVTEVLVEPSSTLINRLVSELPVFEKHGVTLLGMVRGGQEGTLLVPGPYNRIRSADTLILQGEPESIVRLRDEIGLRQTESAQFGDTHLSSSDVQLVEAVVPPDSTLVGHTLEEVEFKDRTSMNILAISKHGHVQAQKIARTRLETGDTLLVQGHVKDVERVRRERDLLVLGEVKRPLFGRGARISLALLAAVLVVSALDVLPLSVAALGGATALVLTRCVPPKELYVSIDWVVLVLVGGMLALGQAFDKHGLSVELAHRIHGMGRGFEDPRVMLGLLLVSTVILSQLTTHVAAAVLLAPVAMSISSEMGVSDRPFLMAVLTGAACAFMSPVAHPVNAMVAGAGDYRYRDFLRVGTPITLLMIVVALILIPILWPFTSTG